MCAYHALAGRIDLMHSPQSAYSARAGCLSFSPSSPTCAGKRVRRQARGSPGSLTPPAMRRPRRSADSRRRPHGRATPTTSSAPTRPQRASPSSTSGTRRSAARWPEPLRVPLESPRPFRPNEPDKLRPMLGKRRRKLLRDLPASAPPRRGAVELVSRQPRRRQELDQHRSIVSRHRATSCSSG